MDLLKFNDLSECNKISITSEKQKKKHKKPSKKLNLSEPVDITKKHKKPKKIEIEQINTLINSNTEGAEVSQNSIELNHNIESHDNSEIFIKKKTKKRKKCESESMCSAPLSPEHHEKKKKLKTRTDSLNSNPPEIQPSDSFHSGLEEHYVSAEQTTNDFCDSPHIIKKNKKVQVDSKNMLAQNSIESKLSSSHINSSFESHDNNETFTKKKKKKRKKYESESMSSAPLSPEHHMQKKKVRTDFLNSSDSPEVQYISAEQITNDICNLPHIIKKDKKDQVDSKKTLNRNAEGAEIRQNSIESNLNSSDINTSIESDDNSEIFIKKKTKKQKKFQSESMCSTPLPSEHHTKKKKLKILTDSLNSSDSPEEQYISAEQITNLICDPPQIIKMKVKKSNLEKQMKKSTKNSNVNSSRDKAEHLINKLNNYKDLSDLIKLENFTTDSDTEDDNINTNTLKKPHETPVDRDDENMPPNNSTVTEPQEAPVSQHKAFAKSDIEQVFDLSESEKQVLRSLKIIITFEVPLLHKLHCAATPPTADELRSIQSANLKYITGPYTKEEDKKIVKNFKDFCKVHNIAENPPIFFSFVRKPGEPILYNNEAKKRILRWLARGLPNRLVHSVYQRFKRLHMKQHFKTGKFSPAEDEQIMDYITHSRSPHFCKDLSVMLNRSIPAIQKRIIQLRKTDKEKQLIRWSDDKVHKIALYLMKSIGTKNVADLQNAKFSRENWQYVSDRLEGIPIDKAKHMWKIVVYPRLFVENCNLDDVKKQLVTILYENKFNDWRAIKWKKIAEQIPGHTGASLYFLFDCLRCRWVPKRLRSNCKDSIDLMYQTCVVNGETGGPKRLKKIIIKDM